MILKNISDQSHVYGLLKYCVCLSVEFRKLLTDQLSFLLSENVSEFIIVLFDIIISSSLVFFFIERHDILSFCKRTENMSNVLHSTDNNLPCRWKLISSGIEPAACSPKSRPASHSATLSRAYSPWLKTVFLL